MESERTIQTHCGYGNFLYNCPYIITTRAVSAHPGSWRYFFLDNFSFPHIIIYGNYHKQLFDKETFYMTIETIKRMLTPVIRASGSGIASAAAEGSHFLLYSISGCHPVAGTKRRPSENIGHQRCAELAAPRRDPDRQGDGDGWLSAKENLAGRQTHHLHFHHRSGQGALTDV